MILLKHSGGGKKDLYSEQERKLFTPDGNIRRYLHSDVVDKFEEGMMATTSFPNGYDHGPRTHKESISLTTNERPSVKQNLRIRKLTPTECFRLQGVSDEDIQKLNDLSDNTKYHLAGDSIITTCLMAIFGEMFGIDWKEKIEELMNDWNNGTQSLDEEGEEGNR